MNMPCCVTLALAMSGASCPSTSERCHSDDDLAAEVVAAISDLAESADQLESRIAVVGPVVIEMPNVREEFPHGPLDNPEQYVRHVTQERRTIVWRHCEGPTLIELLGGEGVIQSSSRWDGQKWYEVTSEAGPTQFAIAAKIERPPFGMKLLSVFNGGVDFRSMLHTRSLDTFLRSAELLRAETSDDVVEATWKTENPLFYYETTLQLDRETMRLRRLSHVTYGKEGERRPLDRIELTIAQWHRYDECWLPSEAYIWETMYDMPSRRGLAPIANYTVYKRLSASDEVDCEQLRQPPTAEHGTVVHDRTLSISYIIGHDAIQIDGNRRKLRAPVTKLITTELPDLIDKESDK